MAKLTRKSYKRKRVVLGAVLLGAVALVSTGFAAWVLSSNATADATGNVQVGVVNNTDMSISLSSASMNQTISFNADKDDNTGRIRYSDSDKIPAENLTVTISGTITNTDYFQKLTIKMDKIDGIDKAIEGNFIALNNADTWYGEEFEISTVDGGDGTKTFSYELGFKWGSAFGNMNPSIYYDTEGQGKDVSDAEMKAQLAAFKKAIGNLDETTDEANALSSSPSHNYKVTLTAYNS